MTMLFIISWKNIWRNKRRSAIIIVAIALGLWGGLFAAALMEGMAETMVSAAIDRDLSHIQIHHAKFREERLFSQSIPHPDPIVDSIRKIPGVSAVSPRAVIEGIASSATSSHGLKIVGINPVDEYDVSSVGKKMVEGEYFKNDNRPSIVIGKKLSEKLALKLRSKMVLSFQGHDGTIIYGAFRIVGIFETESSIFDGGTIFIKRNDLWSLLDTAVVHEIAVRLSSSENLNAVQSLLTVRYPTMDIATWKDLAPEMKLTSESTTISMNIFLGIILFALLFGITNTMLMAVLDRTREFGMLMAVGMKRIKIFFMIIVETIALSITGGFGGIMLGSVSIEYFNKAGIDLSIVSGGLSMYGISSMLYPVLPASTYPLITIMIILTAIAAAIYPALKAIHLNPASAVRTYA
jgi:putative ABC transport system permease protein